ncbi:hypothetical protein GCM10010435_44140 [Winogradskya consettensis]|uniref:Uncharacterized protein n=1 Tax=Winogradskya consettensis TaxID=113560 RepID=A0A919T0F1_9ACTN|nr:hypothetical protein [Actinoplanes consettensis]GIM82641.1 hypothetical protein Aco04nite_82530 [Actinoplanes consettensis]
MDRSRDQLDRAMIAYRRGAQMTTWEQCIEHDADRTLAGLRAALTEIGFDVERRATSPKPGYRPVVHGDALSNGPRATRRIPARGKEEAYCLCGEVFSDQCATTALQLLTAHIGREQARMDTATNPGDGA